jgi:hypothetical protein
VDGSKARVLVAFENSYLVYREAIASAIRRCFSPQVDVVVGEAERLEAELRRFEPHLVICCLPNPSPQDGTLSWVELSVDPDRPSTVCLDGYRREAHNPSLEELLCVVEEANKLIK